MKDSSPFFELIILSFLIVHCSAQLFFNYTTFTPNIHDFNYSGDATTSDHVIQLTMNQRDRFLNYSSGRVTYSKLLHLWDQETGDFSDFTTHFSFIINSQKRRVSADGMTFFLASDGFPFPDVHQGDGIGLVSGSQTLNSSLNPFVAVEFDTFSNSWDPRGNHVGININSMKSVTSTTWDSNVTWASMNEAWVSYNSSSKNLSVVFTGFSQDKAYLQGLHYKVDLRHYLPEWVSFGFTAATGEFFEIHTLNSWDFISCSRFDEDKKIGMPPKPGHNLSPNSKQKRKQVPRAVILLGLSTSACSLLAGLGFLLFCYIKKWRRGQNNNQHDFHFLEEIETETGPKKFTYKQLAAATNNFAEEQKVGEGGFGGVYKGFLIGLDSHIAVKRISSGSKQGVKEYASEIKIISRLRHRNLVQLIGWCHEDRQLLLVYEFMPNGSLDSHIFRRNNHLTWTMRYNIARDLGSALLYLHEEWNQCVLHRDIKSSNIMLDFSFNAKLGDFGLARLVDHEKGTQTTRLAGTMGYLAPECVKAGKVSKESDVYSFGVVALEIACGRRPIVASISGEEKSLVDYVWEFYGTGKLVELVDPELSADSDEKQVECMIIVGLWCAHPDYKYRPSIKQALQVLSFEAPLPSLPLTLPASNFSAAPVDIPALHFSGTDVLTI